MLRACEAPRASGEIINVATGGRISLNQLFEEMRKLVGGTLTPVYEAPRQGDVRFASRHHEGALLLGYQPTVSFDEAAENDRVVSDGRRGGASRGNQLIRLPGSFEGWGG